MATTPEGKVKAALAKKLKELGVYKTTDALTQVRSQPANCLLAGWYYMPSSNGYGEAGVWDFIGCYNTKFFAIETKAGSGKLTAHQKIKGSIFAAINAKRYVVSSVEEANAFDFDTSPQYQP